MIRQIESGEDGKPVLQGEEKILHVEPDTELYFETKASKGKGTLYVTSKNFIWIGPNKKGFSLDVPFVMMHAVNTTGAPFPKPCIYCQLDLDDVSEVAFCPATKERLQDLYKAFCLASELNPPSEEGLEDSGDFFYNEAEVENNLIQSIEQSELAASEASGMNGHTSISSGVEAMHRQSFEDAEEGDEDDGQMNTEDE
eukprot:gb/GEZN01014427.1/.p1 GENE.gb/GEZN01014427.1/~~gb/GEZN01014427.1/.p1  ORF type:complete len:198 (-),score=38.67 gb/GEZN01014427.1/:336-929(-)